MQKKINIFSGKVCAELDLHMLTRPQAEVELYDFLEKADSLGFRRVRIITGKGIHSEKEGWVLKPFIQNILRLEKLQFKDAPLDRGGTGAIDVWLY